MKISVLIKEPGEAPRHSYIENTLEKFQEIVGGHIEKVSLARDMAVICNENGILQGLPFCCKLRGMKLVGPVIIAGTRKEKFIDLPGSLKDWKQWFASLWMPICKFCGMPVRDAKVHHAECWQEKASALAEKFCDDYCRWPRECADEDELHDKHCDSCDLIHVLNLGL